jgi:hypothetical protein
MHDERSHTSELHLMLTYQTSVQESTQPRQELPFVRIANQGLTPTTLRPHHASYAHPGSRLAAPQARPVRHVLLENLLERPEQQFVLRVLWDRIRI